MAFIDILADVSGLVAAIDRNTAVETRIAEALERLSPPVPLPPEERPDGQPIPDSLNHPSFAESPEQYQERVDSEAAFALSLGVAPWSPAFQVAINEMRQELLKPKVEVNEETGERIERQYTEAEADEIVRDAFKLARAQANFASKAEAFEKG